MTKMVVSLKGLSNTQLCQVFNTLTGQKVKRFSSIAHGVDRIAEVLDGRCLPVEALPAVPGEEGE